jgi:uncharacterized membrane protein
MNTTAGQREKYLLFGVIAMMATYVAVHNESFLINPNHPAWQHYEPFKWVLLPHGLAGALALMLAPFQFSERLRKKYTQIHRIAGRVYVGAVCVAAPIGVLIQHGGEAAGLPRSFTAAATLQMSAWLVTTLVAWYCIRTGRKEQHRQWMTRSFAVALVFLEVRVIAGLGGWDGNVHAIEAIVWLCNGLTLLGADLVI